MSLLLLLPLILRGLTSPPVAQCMVSPLALDERDEEIAFRTHHHITTSCPQHSTGSMDPWIGRSRCWVLGLGLGIITILDYVMY